MREVCRMQSTRIREEVDMNKLAIRFKLESFEIFSDPLEGWETPEVAMPVICSALRLAFPTLEVDCWAENVTHSLFFAIECGLPTAEDLGIDYKKEMEEDAKSAAGD